MNEGYTKLFSSITTSSIWQESNETRIIWVTLLAMANADGEIPASVPGLAHIARVSIEDAEKALETLSAPDPYSRTPDHEGRRIEKVPGGWRLLNHDTYRARMCPQEQREKTRIRVQRHRERKKQKAEKEKALQNVTGVTGNESNDTHTQTQTQLPKDSTCPVSDETGRDSSKEQNSVSGTDPKPDAKENAKVNEARIALHFLNESANRRFRETRDNLDIITRCLKKPGITLEGVKQMIQRQCNLWLNTELAEYLKPRTLFNGKFCERYDDREQPLPKKGNRVDRSIGTQNEGRAHEYDIESFNAG